MTNSDVVSIDYDLNNSSIVSDNNSCGDDGYLFRMRSYRPWVFHVGATNTFIIIIFNSMVVRAFRQKNLLSSATIPLIVLALCDIMACVFMFWPNELGFLLQSFHYDKSRETDVFLHINRMNYPFCILSEVSYYLGHVSHSSSLLLTSLVSVQKALVVQFPLWSKVYLMKKRVILTISLCTVFLTFCLHSSLVFYTVYPSNNEKWCCRRLNFVKRWNAKGHKQILLVCYMICFVTMVMSSLYIAFSLTCRRRNKNDNRVWRKRHRRSAIIVILIACFCIFTELIPFSCRSSLKFKQLCSNDIHQFELLILQFGFAANFLIYIVMSEKLRSRIMFCRTKVWEMEHSRKSRGLFTSLTSLNYTSTTEKENRRAIRASLTLSLSNLNRHSIVDMGNNRQSRNDFSSLPILHRAR